MPTQNPKSFAIALPKIELHAHLTGSITRQTLHEIWLHRKVLNSSSPSSSPDFPLEDPLLAIPAPEEKSINVATFFPLFDKYIYSLVDSIAAVRFATRAVLGQFLDDGCVYAEFRTTPRVLNDGGEGDGRGEDGRGKQKKEEYVRAVLETMGEFLTETKGEMGLGLILSVDRRNMVEEAMDAVDLALKYRDERSLGPARVVGLDLCGNPAAVPMTHLSPAFRKAHAHSLPITLHFAETPTSSSASELATLLSWRPARLGHVIHVPAAVREEIARRKLGLELCLSCNVLAGLSGEGGYAAHHFGYWRGEKACAIALGTDDVGVFGASLSREYELAAEHFRLSRDEVVGLARGAVEVIFGGEREKQRLRVLFDAFERDFCTDKA